MGDMKPLEDEPRSMIRVAVILATDEKGLQRVFGIPAVRRLILLTGQLGLEAVHLVGRVSSLWAVISDLISPNAVHQLEDPALLGGVVQKLNVSDGAGVLVLRANHVVDRVSLTRLMEMGERPGLYLLGANKKSGVDGIYIASLTDLASLLPALWLRDISKLDILDRAQHVEGVSGLPSVIDRKEDLVRISEAKLVTALAFQTKERDGFLARHLSRRISRSFSKRLAHTAVAPNQITLVGVTIGMVGAFFLSRPGYWPQLMGSVLFLCFAVIDGVDGEVSRLRLQESQFGYYLDMITDNIVNVAIFAGIAFGLYHETADGIYLKVLLFLFGGFGLCAISVYYNISRRSQDELRRSPKITRFMALLTNSDFAYLIVALALIHRLQWFLFAVAVGTYLFAATLWAASLYKKRAARL
jgi:phosphatidylglycerophosphate synthase